MRYPAYPSYRPSGIEWLGEVPEHWRVEHVRRTCRFAYGDSLAANDREEGKVPVFGSNGPVGEHNTPNTLAPVIIVGRKGSHGKVNYAQRPVFAIDTTYFIDKRHTSNDLRWLYYMLGSLRLDAVSKDSAVPGLAREDAYGHLVATPPLSEQRAIADFLDAQTGRLDTLVAKKRALIEKLKEKRSALISQTVTRGLPTDAARSAGLDPQPRLKPSGVAWLGDVPEHWDAKRLKHLGTIRYGLGEPPGYVSDGLPFIRATDIYRGKIDLDFVKMVSPDDVPWSRKPQLSLNEILVVRSGAYTGDSAIVTRDVALGVLRDTTWY